MKVCQDNIHNVIVVIAVVVKKNLLAIQIRVCFFQEFEVKVHIVKETICQESGVYLPFTLTFTSR